MEKFNIGWQLLVMGMGIVFLILFMLSVIFKTIGKHLGAQKQAKPVEITSAPVQTTTAQADNKNAKVAAIMAAIQAVMGDTEYRVISIRPTDQSFWKQAVKVGPELKFQGRRGK